MAQLDTGLGWSAKEEWLMRLPGQFSSIDSFDDTNFPGQPLPVGSTRADFAATKFRVGYNFYNYVLTLSGEDGPVFVFAQSRTSVVWCSPVQNAKYYTGNEDRQTGNIGQTISEYTCRYASSGWYYWSITYGSDMTTTLPTYGSIAAGIAAIQAAFVKDLVTKDNEGYAVACNASWKTDNGVLITTPVLISSESSYVDMTCTNTSYNLAKLNVRSDGITFYMSFFDAVDKTLSGSVQVADLSMFKLDLPQVFNLIAQSGMANIQVTETVDPYEDFGYTEEDAGEINPNPQDDDIEVDDLPTKSFASAGFCRIYNPDISDLNDLASYMWTDQTFLQTVINHLKQIIENPIEAIISLSMVPVQPQVGPSKVPVNVMFISTGVSMRPVTSQFVSVDCGTTVLQEVYGGALDYNPYTSVQIYLPYIGTVQLDTDEVMAKTLHLTYHIDVVTGICCAEIEVDNKLLYQFSGHCSVSQPITSADFSSYLNAAIAAAKLVVGVASGSASVTATAAAAQTPPEVSGSKSAPQSTALVPASGGGSIGPHLGSPGSRSPHNWTDFSDIAPPESSSGIAWGELAKPGNVNTVASVMSAKRAVQHSGGFSGNSGYLAKRRPYLIVVRPRIANPQNYAQHFGRTSMEYLNLGSCTGYTKVQSVHLTGFDATNPELSEISSLLKGGVLM